MGSRTDIFITGIGVISSIGRNTNECLESLRTSRTGLYHSELVSSNYASKYYFGDVKISDQTLKQSNNISDPSISRTSLLAIEAINQCLENAQIDREVLERKDTALVIGNTVGGMCLTDELYNDSNFIGKPSPYIQSYDCGSVALMLQQFYKIGGIVNTINTACSSSANAILYGARLLLNGFAKRVIAGGVDSLSKFTINGFNSLGILTDTYCCPFDEERKGLNLGEGAGFILLELEEDLKEKTPHARLTGYANANDSFHPSSLSEDGTGPLRCMVEALKVSGLRPEEIDFINTHGTGTENNDLVESVAMIKIFGDIPPFISTKSKIGHTLGASAAIESVFGILSIMNNEIYPSLGFKKPIEQTGLIPVSSLIETHVSNVMVNSFGFGGNCSSLIYSSV
ncbi:MAG: beta-ketoacyl-[acyl-carrier-protein] synthase family protein [Flavobacteriales bacterium]|nr:beta-ketoacyl-[acyl-carrier-protein] synthase family protein [Flavobacteriales bacterium]